ncbi:MAG TPA: DUF4292 domain-containing protein [Puia sp.]|jgi:hypothetical protein|nr:DUF4292 domain-containing protein [Puia sp.]
MKKIFYFTACLVLIVFASCRSTKKIQTIITAPPHIDTVQTPPVVSVDLKADSIKFMHNAFFKIQRNRIDFRTFSAKIKVHYQASDGKDNDFTAYLLMIKDSVIWVRVSATIVDYEAFRLLVTRDSVKLINRLNKTYQVRSVNYLQDVIHIPLSFKTLQDLLIGNPVYLDSNIIYYKKEPTHLVLMSVGNIFKNYMMVNKDNYTVQHSKLDDIDVTRARTCEITYSDYAPLDSTFFSMYRQVSVTEKTSVDIQLNFKEYNFNRPLSISFKVPKNYKRK